MAGAHTGSDRPFVPERSVETVQFAAAGEVGVGDVDVVVRRVHQDGVRVADAGEVAAGEAGLLEGFSGRVDEIDAVVIAAFHLLVVSEADEGVAAEAHLVGMDAFPLGELAGRGHGHQALGRGDGLDPFAGSILRPGGFTVGGNPDPVVGGDHLEEVRHRSFDVLFELEGGQVDDRDAVVMDPVVTAAVGDIQLSVQDGEAFRLVADFHGLGLIGFLVDAVHFSGNHVLSAINGCTIGGLLALL